MATEQNSVASCLKWPRAPYTITKVSLLDISGNYSVLWRVKLIMNNGFKK